MSIAFRQHSSPRSKESKDSIDRVINALGFFCQNEYKPCSVLYMIRRLALDWQGHAFEVKMPSLSLALTSSAASPSTSRYLRGLYSRS